MRDGQKRTFEALPEGEMMQIARERDDYWRLQMVQTTRRRKAEYVHNASQDAGCRVQSAEYRGQRTEDRIHAHTHASSALLDLS